MTSLPLAPPARQRGATLAIGLIFLLIITIIGLSSARLTVTQTRLAGNVQNRSIAVQSAEAALRFAEAGIAQGIYTNFAGNANGLYTFDPNNASPWYSDTAVTWSSSSTSVIAYGGPSLPNLTSASGPLFIIEQLPPVALPGESISLATYGSGIPSTNVYRVTSRATGGDANSFVKIQSIVR